jgi:hypothetical protein
LSAKKPPRSAYWHVWTDADGVSRQSRCEFTEFELAPINAGSAPQWQGRKTSAPCTTFVTVLPVGWCGDWHENPKPQWVIPLSGRWYVETMDGQRVEMGPGELSFGEDQATRDGRGHRSGTLGEAPAVVMIIQFEDGEGAGAPCRFG